MSTPRLPLALALALPLLAAAQAPRVLARVAEVQGGAVTLEVLEGYVTTGQALELWTEGGKRAVQVAAVESDYVDARRAARGVKLSGPAPAVGALLAGPGQYATWADASAALARIPPRGLARVVAAAGGKVTLEVLVGAITSGEDFELVSASGRAPVKVTLPADVGLLVAGDKVAVELSGGTPAVGWWWPTGGATRRWRRRRPRRQGARLWRRQRP
jgi:hypothetical protein